MSAAPPARTLMLYHYSVVTSPSQGSALAGFPFCTLFVTAQYPYSEKTARLEGRPSGSRRTELPAALAVNSADDTTLVTAVKAAGLVDTLQNAGPFTVFAPTNEVFAMLPAGTVDTLLKPENKETLTKVLTCHVVAGKMFSKDPGKAIESRNGTATLKTVSGGTIKATTMGKTIILTDERDFKRLTASRGATPHNRRSCRVRPAFSP